MSNKILFGNLDLKIVFPVYLFGEDMECLHMISKFLYLLFFLIIFLKYFSKEIHENIINLKINFFKIISVKNLSNTSCSKKIF